MPGASSATGFGEPSSAKSGRATGTANQNGWNPAPPDATGLTRLQGCAGMGEQLQAVVSAEPGQFEGGDGGKRRGAAQNEDHAPGGGVQIRQRGQPGDDRREQCRRGRVHGGASEEVLGDRERREDDEPKQLSVVP